jgi:hypothetical protein
VRSIGVSGTLPNLVEQIEMGVFDAFQIPYSALQREHENVISRAAAAGAGIIIRGGVARGAPTDWQRRYYMLPGATMRELWEKARLDDLLGGMSRLEFTLRLTLSNPDLDTTIVGTRDAGHLRDNIAAKAPCCRQEPAPFYPLIPGPLAAFLVQPQPQPRSGQAFQRPNVFVLREKSFRMDVRVRLGRPQRDPSVGILRQGHVPASDAVRSGVEVSESCVQQAMAIDREIAYPMYPL